MPEFDITSLIVNNISPLLALLVIIYLQEKRQDKRDERQAAIEDKREKRQAEREARQEKREAELSQIFTGVATNLALMNQRQEDGEREHVERYERLRAEHRDIQSALSRRGIGQAQ
jgi:hypothetical protein